MSRKIQNSSARIFISEMSDMFPALVGFAGYFDAVLYKDVHLGIEPSTATPNMFSW